MWINMWITWIFDIWFYDKYAVKKVFVDKKNGKFGEMMKMKNFRKQD